MVSSSPLWSRRYGCGAAVLAGTALVLANIPLFNLLGFEFCALLALVATYVVGYLTVAETYRQRRQALIPPTATAILSWWGCLAWSHSALLLPPLGIILLNGLRVKNCNLGMGFAFFGLIPFVTTLYVTAVGIFFGFWATTRRRAFLLVLAYTLGTLAISLSHILFQPPVFAYNDLIGFFPGPLYDEVVAITPTLLLARLVTLTVGVVFLLLTIVLFDREEDVVRFSQLFHWPSAGTQSGTRVAAGILVLACCGLAGVYWFRGDLGVWMSRDYIQQTLGGHLRTGHFDLYYDQNSEAAAQINLIGRDHEFRYAQLVDWFQVKPRQRIRSYIYASPEQKKRLMGARQTSIEDPLNGEIHLNYEPFPHPALKHELAHLLASSFGNVFGGSYKIGLHEGIAVAADWNSGALTPHQWGQAMRLLGIAPDIRNLLGAFGFWTEAASRSYTLSGSFVRYLIDTYGIEVFKKVFPRGDFKAAYGRSLDELVEEWEARLSQIELTEEELRLAHFRFTRPSIFQKVCAHEMAEIKNRGWNNLAAHRYADAKAVFSKAVGLVPADLDGWRGLLYTQYKRRAYTEALDTVEQLIQHSKEHSLLELAAALRWKGDILWLIGRRAEAKMVYQQAYGKHPSGTEKRALEARLAALSEAAVEQQVMTYLLAERSDEEAWVNLLQVLQQRPEFGLGFYLAGRQLVQSGGYQTAVPYLSRALELSLPSPAFRFETYRLVGVAHFRLGQYRQALRSFQQSRAVEGIPPGWVVQAEEWMARCRWALDKIKNEE